MKVSIWAAVASAGAALAACSSGPVAPEPADAFGPPARTVSADVRDPAGITMARATVSEAPGGLRVRVEAMGMRAGAFAAHVHAAGRCDPPDFTSAGPHWNPTAQQHGKNNPQGMHKGDLPNLNVGTDGRGSFEVTIPAATMGGGGPNALLDADGAAVVIHTGPDDYRTDPSGNSGGRIACGVIR